MMSPFIARWRSFISCLFYSAGWCVLFSSVVFVPAGRQSTSSKRKMGFGDLSDVLNENSLSLLFLEKSKELAFFLPTFIMVLSYGCIEFKSYTVIGAGGGYL